MENTNVYHVRNDGQKATIEKVTSLSSHYKVLDDLDFRASDLLQANGIVWVEGPSDKVYLRYWIDQQSKKSLIEGLHYQILFYGGRLLSHLEISTSQAERTELINILFTNRNAIILMDSDKDNEESKLNATKMRILEGAGAANVECWVTQGREIENYIPKGVVASAMGIEPKDGIGRFERMEDYLARYNEKVGVLYKTNKIDFAEKIIANWDSKNSQLDMVEKLSACIAKIRSWNRLATEEMVEA
jgi:hypothetical protein